MAGMNYAQLRAFHAVATEGSFTGAARARGVTQPAITAQVRALEDHYGVALFDRRGRRVTPTPLGAELLSVTDKLFATEESCHELLSSARDVLHGQLRLGADAPRYVMPVLTELRRTHPALSLSLSVGNCDRVLGLLLDYRIDVAVLGEAGPDARVHRVPFGEQRLMLLLPSDHGWARERDIPLVRLTGKPLVLREPGSLTRRILETGMQEAGVAFEVAMVIESREAMCEAVASGLGPAVVLSGEALPDPRLATVPLRGEGLTAQQWAVCLNERQHLRLVNAFITAVETVTGGDKVARIPVAPALDPAV